MKKSELKEHEKIAYKFYLEYTKGDIRTYPQARALVEFGKEIAEKLGSELKSVDMSVLVDSGVDCVFDECNIAALHEIVEADPVYTYVCDKDNFHKHCKPRMDYWFSTLNFGGSRTIVNFLRDAGFNIEEKLYPGCICAIEAFKITGLKDGYCWPWEAKDER